MQSSNMSITNPPHAGSSDPTLILYKIHQSGCGSQAALNSPSIEKGYHKLSGAANSNFFLVWHPSDPDRLASLDEQGIRSVLWGTTVSYMKLQAWNVEILNTKGAFFQKTKLV